MEGHIDSRQDEEDDHENEVLISVTVTSANDDILVQDEENLTSDEMFPHEDGERYTQHLHVSTKRVGETIQTTTQSETESNPFCVLHVNQEQPPFDSDITAGTCLAHRKDNEKAGTTHCRLNLARQLRLFWATQKKLYNLTC